MCLYVLSVYVSCKLLAYTLYLLSLLSSQNKEAGPFVATQTGLGDHFRLPKVVHGPILVAKFGPARTSFILAVKIGQGDHFGVGPISRDGPILVILCLSCLCTRSQGFECGQG